MRYFWPLAIATVFLAGSESWLPDDKLVAATEARVRAIQPTRAERRFDEIGWAPSILAAEEAARESNRLVFLFTYDGNIDTGRC